MSKNDSNELTKERLGIFIIVNAIVWGAVIVGAAMILKGTGQYQRLMPLLASGAGMSIVILPAILVKKGKKDTDA